jgi:hypothetical protein
LCRQRRAFPAATLKHDAARPIWRQCQRVERRQGKQQCAREALGGVFIGLAHIDEQDFVAIQQLGDLTR